MFLAEGASSAKALRWEGAWSVRETKCDRSMGGAGVREAGKGQITHIGISLEFHPGQLDTVGKFGAGV